MEIVTGFLVLGGSFFIGLLAAFIYVRLLGPPTLKMFESLSITKEESRQKRPYKELKEISDELYFISQRVMYRQALHGNVQPSSDVIALQKASYFLKINKLDVAEKYLCYAVREKSGYGGTITRIENYLKRIREVHAPEEKPEVELSLEEKLDVYKIDKGIRPLIKKLWEEGIGTFSSCEHQGYVTLSPVEDEKKLKLAEEILNKYGFYKAEGCEKCNMSKKIHPFFTCCIYCGAGIDGYIVFKRLEPEKKEI